MEQKERSMHTSSIPVNHAVLISNILVEIHLSIVPSTIFGAETSSEDMAVIDTDVFSGFIEARHFELVVCRKIEVKIVDCSRSGLRMRRE
jgi:hypothetical protein